MNKRLPDRMLAALFEGKSSIRLAEVPVPAPGPDTVVIEVEVAGICGSDLHSYRGKSLRGRFDEWKSLGFADGHELCGHVVEVGNRVTDLNPGAYVTAEAVWHCGQCRMCRSGLYHICLKRQDLAWRGHGAFAQFAFIPRSSVHTLPTSLSASQGAMVEPLAAACHVVEKSGAALGDRVVIIGGGTIGLLSASVARAAGARSVRLMAKYLHQVDIASEMGVDAFLAGDSKVVQLVGSSARFGFDAVIETTGSESGFGAISHLARKGATAVLAGGYPEPLTVDLAPVVGMELKLVGSLCYGWSGPKLDFETAIDLIENGPVDVRPLVTHTLPFEQIAEAFKIAADKTSGSVKVQLRHTE